MVRYALLLVLLFSLALPACKAEPAATAVIDATATVPAAPEQAVWPIPLAGPLTDRDAEVSGLAWYGDYLIILPQYPGRFSSEADGLLFAIPRAELLAFVEEVADDLVTPEPITPLAVPFVAPGLARSIPGFEGYEAIAFQGERVFVTIEAERGAMRGYLVAGQIAPDLSAIRLDVDRLAQIAPQADLGNMAYESLIVAGETLVTLYEANGVNVNPGPVAKRFDIALNPLDPLPFSPIEYRVTDATALDDDGRFWAINYFYPGDTHLRPGPDPLVAAYGEGPTHARYRTVERLVEFQYGPTGVTLSGTPPLQLTLTDEARNWEGLVRLEGRGFVLMTDTHPRTILAFVPAP